MLKYSSYSIKISKKILDSISLSLIKTIKYSIWLKNLSNKKHKLSKHNKG